MVSNTSEIQLAKQCIEEITEEVMARAEDTKAPAL
jgi:hypothetical protein